MILETLLAVAVLVVGSACVRLVYTAVVRVTGVVVAAGLVAEADAHPAALAADPVVAYVEAVGQIAHALADPDTVEDVVEAVGQAAQPLPVVASVAHLVPRADPAAQAAGH